MSKTKLVKKVFKQISIDVVENQEILMTLLSYLKVKDLKRFIK